MHTVFWKAFCASFFILLGGVTLRADVRLRQLVREGNAGQVRAILDEFGRQEARKAINDPDEQGQTALLLAAQRGDKDILKMLADEGGDINAHITFDGNPITALDFLLKSKQQTLMPIISLFLKHGGVTGTVLAKGGLLFDDFLSRDTSGAPKFEALWNDYDTAIDEMLEKIQQSFEVAEVLVIQASTISQLTDKTGKTLLHHAAYAGDLTMIKKLVEDEGMDPDAQDNDLQTPMHSLVEGGFKNEGARLDLYEKVALALYELGASLSIKDRDHRDVQAYAKHLFHVFFKFTSSEATTVKARFERRFKVFVDSFYTLALMGRDIEKELRRVRQRGGEAYKKFQYIREVGAGAGEKGEVTYHVKEPRHEFVEKLEKLPPVGSEIFQIIGRGVTEELKMFLETERPDLDQRDPEGKTPLHLAVENAGLYTETIELLLKYGVYLDAIEMRFGRTPLHIAARRGELHIVKLLVEHGATILVRDRNGITPSGMVGFDNDEASEDHIEGIIEFLGEAFAKQEKKRRRDESRFGKIINWFKKKK